MRGMIQVMEFLVIFLLLANLAVIAYLAFGRKSGVRDDGQLLMLQQQMQYIKVAHVLESAHAQDGHRH